MSGVRGGRRRGGFFHSFRRAYSTGLVRFGTGSETSLSQLPHSLIVDRCYVHWDASVGGRRGIALNSGATAVIDSYISDWKGVGEDTQAIAGIEFDYFSACPGGCGEYCFDHLRRRFTRLR